MLVLDIETVPIERDLKVAEKYLAQPDARKKDPEKVQANLEEVTAKRIKQKSLNPFMGKIVCIGVILPSTPEGGGITFCGDDEKKIITEFWDMIKKRKITFRTIGFNQIGFDLHFLYMRSIINGIKIPVKDLSLKKFSNSPHFDVMQVLSGWQYGEYKSLDFYTEVFEIDEVDPEQNGSKVYGWYKNGEFDTIANYCLQDCRRTLALFRILANQFLSSIKNPFKTYDNIEPKNPLTFDDY